MTDTTHFGIRYRVDQQGRGGMRAYVVDARTHEILMTLQGPDRFEVADAIAATLNASRTETPVKSPKGDARVAAAMAAARGGLDHETTNVEAAAAFEQHRNR